MAMPRPEADVLLDQQHRRPGGVGVADQLRDGGRLFGSSPREGSSSSSTPGSTIRQRAISTIRRWPPERLPARSCDALGHDRDELGHPVVAPGEQLLVPAQRVAAEQHVLPDGHLREQGLRLRHLGHALAEHAGAASRSSRVPSRSTVPSRGLSSPLTTRSTVDLPAPLGPTMQVIAPVGTSRSRPWRTSPPP